MTEQKDKIAFSNCLCWVGIIMLAGALCMPLENKLRTGRFL